MNCVYNSWQKDMKKTAQPPQMNILSNAQFKFSQVKMEKVKEKKIQKSETKVIENIMWRLSCSASYQFCYKPMTSVSSSLLLFFQMKLLIVVYWVFREQIVCYCCCLFFECKSGLGQLCLEVTAKHAEILYLRTFLKQFTLFRYKTEPNGSCDQRIDYSIYCYDFIEFCLFQGL